MTAPTPSSALPVSSLLACRVCKGTEVEFDAAQGNSVCVQCGAVLEENSVVAEVTFAELADGSSALQGQFVSAERGRPSASSGGGMKKHQQMHSAPGESREWTLFQAKRRLQSVSVALGLGEHHVEQAHRWYGLALQHSFTRGRRAGHIIAACLYIVCRMERTPHMLLDFADLLQTSVFVLGGCFLRLVQLLNLQIPIVDPSFYVGRFAARLEFGDACQAVTNTALRVVARMKRDWIQVGRRPAGICAAGLLIAARMHGFRRSEREIVRVVHICEATLRKRLAEFEETPSGALTPEQFEELWLETEADPPAFRAQNKDAAVDDDDWCREIVALQSPPETPQVIVAKPPLYDEDDAIGSDLDDPEVNGILLEPHEAAAKTAWWTNLNQDYLQREQAKLQAAIDAANSDEHEPVARKRPRKKRQVDDAAKSAAEKAPAIVIVPRPVAETAAEAARKAISSKRFSKKINYEALEGLFSATPSASTPPSTAASTT